MDSIMNNDIRLIKQFYTISGQPRNPGMGEHGKKPTFDAVNDVFDYTEDNIPVDAYKDPSSNDVILEMKNGETVHIPLGALAWVNSVVSAVTSVFGRTGAVTAQNGDYTAAQVTNAFNKAVDDLDDLSEGTTNKHFTSTYKNNVDLNTAARHTHTNKAVLDLITDAGGGRIPTEAEIDAWNAFVATTDEHIQDVVAEMIQAATGISWTYNDAAGTLTPTITLSDFTTDNLPEGTYNKYATSTTNNNVIPIYLPAAATVANRCAAAVEGTDYPTGWTLQADTSPVDLLITHDLAREIADVTVFTVDSGTSSKRKLMGTAAYTGFISPDSGNNTIRIEGLATINTEIIIYLIFL